MSLISRRSLDIRSRIRRRSVSILVSPGPRVPTPPPLPPAPPPWRDIDSPQPRSRGSMYSICAKATCALPSAEVACWAKMSRISAVRSMTLTLTTFSSAFSCAGSQLAVADDGVGAGRQDDVAQLRGLARADVGGRVGFVAPLDQALEHLGARGLGQRRELGEAGVGVGGAAVGPDADQHDAFEAQLPVFDLGDVGEFGGEAGNAAQRSAVFEVRVRPCSGRVGIESCVVT